MKVNVGIDLGTTYSAVATFSKELGRVKVLKNSLNNECTPSVVCIQDGNVLIGEEAKEEQKCGNVNTVAFYKSMMGDASWSAYIDGQEYSAEQLSGHFLKGLIDDIARTNNIEIDGAVITVPAYFNDKQREATIRAGKQAGLRVLKIINEPTSAIIAYGLTGGKDKNVMVYDLGGGTFDVTVAHVSGTKIEVLATNGNHQLGGKDWDEVLINDIKDQFYSEHGISIDDHEEDLKELQVKCEEAKKRLSSVPSTVISIQSEGMLGKYTVTREDFADKTSSLLNETISLINSCFEEITDSQNRPFGWNDIDEVVLVGGSTRMPQVKDMIIREYGKPPITKDINVDTIVATGAAMQAELCVNNTITLTVAATTSQSGNNATSANRATPMTLTIHNSDIQDITAHSLGILVYNNEKEQFENSIIIKKGSPYGCFFDRGYFVKNGEIQIYILQGEAEDPYDCLLLFKYKIDCSMLSGQQEVTVGLRYNDDGLVDAKATTTDNVNLNINKVILDKDLDDVLKELKEDLQKQQSPYSKWAGISSIPTTSKDKYGNPVGSDFDLVADGAFKGYSILIITANSFFIENGIPYPIKALKEKGFSVDFCGANRMFFNNLTANFLKKYCQVWLISNLERVITDNAVDLLADYFNEGHGLYLWADNDPLYKDVNPILQKLFNDYFEGNSEGDQILSIQKDANSPGIIKDHLIMTQVSYLPAKIHIWQNEGITVSHLKNVRSLSKLIVGSDGLVVAGIYDKDGKKAIADGGFTRLWHKWDSAGTDRYIVNAAAWLANTERFGYSLSKK